MAYFVIDESRLYLDERLMMEEKLGTSKRERILSAAISVLAERGFHRTKIKDIAQEAGVADGTIYLYFKNKDHLLIDLFEEVMSRALNLFEEALKDKERADQQLEAFLLTHLRIVELEPEVAQIISVVLRQSETFIGEYKNPFFSEYLNIIAKILKQGMETGVFRADISIPIISRAIFGAMDELALAWLLSNKREDEVLEMAAQDVVTLLLDGLQIQSSE